MFFNCCLLYNNDIYEIHPYLYKMRLMWNVENCQLSTFRQSFAQSIQETENLFASRKIKAIIHAWKGGLFYFLNHCKRCVSGEIDIKRSLLDRSTGFYVHNTEGYMI